MTYKKWLGMTMVFLMGINPVLAETVKEYPWVLKRDMEGIKVYNRKVAGSPILEFRSEMILDYPIEKVLELFDDETRICEWFHRCKEAELVENVSPTEKRVYFAADLVLPFYDRDGVYRSVRAVLPENGAVTYTFIPDNKDYPKRGRRVRIQKLSTEWRFTPVEPDRTLIEYRQHSEAGGFIPPVLANLFVVTIPFKSLRKFRAALQ